MKKNITFNSKHIQWFLFLCLSFSITFCMFLLSSCSDDDHEEVNNQAHYQDVPASLLTDAKKLEMVRSIQDLKDGRFFYLDYTEDYKLSTISGYNLTDNTQLIGAVLKTLCDKTPSWLKARVKLDAGCSAFAVTTPDTGDYLMGRNFDYSHDNEPIAAALVRTAPEGGLKSISMVDAYWIGYRQDLWHYILYNKEQFEKHKTQDLSYIMAFPYLLMDGMNEAGFAVSVLHLDGKPTQQASTGKKLTTTLALRMMLDHARTVDEALKILDIDDHYFSELDLRGNQSSENTDDLKRSDVDNVANTGLNLRGCRNLKVIKLTNGKNSLTVKLDTCINLEELTCTTIPEVKGFDVSFAPNLKIINIDHSKWKNLDLTSLKNLEEFSCKDNNLTRLDLSNCKKLKKLNCSGNPIPYLLGCSQLDSLTSIDVSNCVKLEAFPSLPIGIKTIACDNVKSFANVDINMYPNLTELSAANCDLTTFDATNLHDLTALNLSDNHIAAINIAPTQAVDQEKFKLDQRLDITAIPEQGAYWRVLLPPSVDMGRFYSYDFVDNAAKRSYTLYNEYYNGDQGQQPSFVTNYMPTGSAFKKNIIYQYKTVTSLTTAATKPATTRVTLSMRLHQPLAFWQYRWLLHNSFR